MSATRDEITIGIGNLIGQMANLSATQWDFAGYIFDASKKGGSSYLYRNTERLSLETRDFRKEIRTNFLRLREVTPSDGNECWFRCLAMVKNETKEFKILFEFDDPTRWEITPANARDAYNLQIGDIFPEA